MNCHPSHKIELILSLSIKSRYPTFLLYIYFIDVCGTVCKRLQLWKYVWLMILYILPFFHKDFKIQYFTVWLLWKDISIFYCTQLFAQPLEVLQSYYQGHFQNSFQEADGKSLQMVSEYCFLKENPYCGSRTRFVFQSIL